MLTVKQTKALEILKAHPGVSARQFGDIYFDKPGQGYLHTAVSNQGNGACSGKKAWLCAGSLLGKLKKTGLVREGFGKYDRGFHLTEKGRKELEESNRQ